MLDFGFARRMPHGPIKKMAREKWQADVFYPLGALEGWCRGATCTLAIVDFMTFHRRRAALAAVMALLGGYVLQWPQRPDLC